jgi:tRNA pseudouridine13 synthase
LLVPRIEKSIGLEVYATRSPGIGGIIRQNAEDFFVEEMLVDGSKAEIKSSKNQANREVLGSSAARNPYLLCVLVKRNWDTFIALRNIAAQLGISPGQIQIAGIKDAKAITAQHITIEGVSTEDLRKIHIKDIEVRPIGYLRNKLSSFYLMGNSFQIAVKSIDHSKTTVQKRVTRTIQEFDTVGGVPNFFGHQRFGTSRPITHLVGKAVIKGKLKKATMLFLAKPSRYEHPASREARRELQKTQDFKQALKNFPNQLRYERSMLAHLAQRPDDFTGAFRRLPIKLQELFIQAYQSYLFNKFLSKRIEHGLPLNTAREGDYVMNVERSGLPMVTMHKIVDVGALGEINNLVKAGKMRVAIPLIGFKQHPSHGSQGEIEKKILEAEDISVEDFKITALPERATRGELRAVLVPLRDFSLDEISRDATNSSKHKAKLSFMLLRGSYATILLRELMKPRDIIEARF